ncbi:MAG TPA: hypothetical protein GXZ55_02960 [Natronincola sp.]|nr:hypothetical protein [Natronincola sp.]
MLSKLISEKDLQGKTKGRNGLIVGFVILVLIAFCVFYLSETGVFLSPSAKFKAVVKVNVVSPIRKPIMAVIRYFNPNSTYSGDLTLRAELPGDSPEIQIFNSGSLRLKHDRNSKRTYNEIDIMMADQTVLSGFIGYELKEDLLGFYFPALDPNYYKVDLDQFNYGFLDIAPVSSIETNWLTSFLIQKEIEALFNRYVDTILGCITDENVTVDRGRTIEMAARNVAVKGCTVLTFKPSKDDLQNLIEQLEKQLRKDLESLKSAVALGTKLNPSGGDDNYLEALSDPNFDNFRYQANQIAKDLIDMGFQWEIALKGMEPVRSRIFIDDVTIMVELIDLENDERVINLSVGEDEEYIRTLAEIDYKYSEKNIDGQLLVFDDYKSPFVKISFDANLKQKSRLGIPYGSYSLITKQQFTPYTLDVFKSSGGSRHILNIPIFWQDKYSIIVDVVEEKVSVDSPSVEPTDISHYSSHELQSLYESLVWKFVGGLM